jgi:hypothetical protein
MSRTAALLAVISTEPTSTSDLYDRIGYAALLRAGLIDYRAFRRTLVELEAEGLADSAAGDDETGTTWRLPAPEDSAPEGAD